MNVFRPAFSGFTACILLTLSATVSRAQTFTPSIDHSVGMKPTVVAEADIDRDGDIDLLSANSAGDSLSILLNDGSGSFPTTQTIMLPLSTGATDMIVQDFDQDGWPDIAVTCSFTNEIAISMNTGIGTFAPFTMHSTGLSPIHVTAEDIDGDGYPELFTTNYLSHNTSIFFNMGNGTFVPVGEYHIGISPSNMAFGDLDGDGDRDLAIALMPFSAVSIFENIGWTFSPAGMVGVGPIPIDLVIADLNNDNILDIATANAGSNTVSVVTGQGNLTFSPPTTYAVPQLPVDLKIGNVDNKLGPDLVTANFNGWSASVLTNDGYGAFSAATVIQLGVNTTSVCLADFDGDCFIDVAASNLGSSNVSVLLSRAPAIPYPGTSEGLELYSGINSPPVTGPGEYIKHAPALSTVNIGVMSPGGTHTNSSIVIGAQLFIEGYPPFNGYPGVHLNAFGFGGAIIFQAPVLSPVGNNFSITAPVALIGINILFQAIAPSVVAVNHIFVSSDAHEIRITP